MTRDQLSRSFRSFLDRLYVLQRVKLFIKPRVLPLSPPVQPRILRCQIVDLIQKYRRYGVSTDDGAPSAHASRWQLDVQRSLIPNAGDGVFVRGCSVPPRTLLTLYPGQTSSPSPPHLTHCTVSPPSPPPHPASGTIYMPWQRDRPRPQSRESASADVLLQPSFFKA